MSRWYIRALTVLAVLVASYALAIDIRVNPPRLLVGEWWRMTATVKIGDERIHAYVRDTPKGRAAGLSDRDELRDGEGMLFVFPEDGFHTFWMKDMKFSIDIVWVAADGRIVDIRPSVSPDTYPEFSFAPQQAARYVLELPAGWAARHDIAIGGKLNL